MCEMQKTLTVEQVADVLQVHIRTVRRLIAAGELEAFKVGRPWRIRQSALADYIERQEEKRDG